MTILSGSLDTNALLRLILDDIPDQSQAIINLLENTAGKFFVADTALIEMAFVLDRHYHLNREEIANIIIEFLNYSPIKCNKLLFENAIPIYTKNVKLSFEDCCLAVYSGINGAAPLWTFDKKLANQAPNTKLIPL